ncbi:hypothetical protein ACHQM5_025125 [Ranunculus cassubicifolius]
MSGGGGSGGGEDFVNNDHVLLLRSNSSASESDIEVQRVKRKGFTDLLKQLDRGFSGRRLSNNSIGNRSNKHLDSDSPAHDTLGDGAPPEWALLLIGCLLGLATGICVAAFNKGVHIIHEWAWAGTPNEGAAWLRLQRLADTWHRILLIPVTGGVVVGMLHGLVEIVEQIKQSRASPRQDCDFLSGVFPTIKAIQAAVCLGTGCSLGPEGPSVDIGKSCAYGVSEMMENNRERRIALVAAGAAAGIASGFNAAVAGCFFAIETVLRPLRAENSPPFTTAMIILSSVISSTVSNVLLGEKPAFTVPTTTFILDTWYAMWNSGLGAGMIALRYPGILYWGFTNVDEILHTGKSASAPGIWLLTQLAAAKVVATALCKGSGLVGGLYAPSLMIGAAVGAVFGGSAAELINSAIPGNAAVAQPQAYALVGMAATLASVCSVPLTSVLLLFELTKDYRILLPLMGAVGLAIWVPSVTNQPKENEASDTAGSARGYSSLPPLEENNDAVWRGTHDGSDLELSVMENATEHETINEEIMLDNLKVSQAMSKNYVKVLPTTTLKDTISVMHDSLHNCILVIDGEDLLEGIVTFGDIQRRALKISSDASSNGDRSVLDVKTCLVSSICTRGIQYRGRERGLITCYPDTDLAVAKELMEAKGIKQLPVVRRGGESRKERKRRVVGLLHYDSLRRCLRKEIERVMYQQKEGDEKEKAVTNGH